MMTYKEKKFFNLINIYVILLSNNKNGLELDK